MAKSTTCTPLLLALVLAADGRAIAERRHKSGLPGRPVKVSAIAIGFGGQDDVKLRLAFDMEAWYLVRAVKPGVRVRDLCKQYQIETLRDYCRRSRQQIDDARKTGKRI